MNRKPPLCAALALILSSAAAFAAPAAPDHAAPPAQNCTAMHDLNEALKHPPAAEHAQGDTPEKGVFQAIELKSEVKATNEAQPQAAEAPTRVSQ